VTSLIFTTQCTKVQSVVLLSHVVCPSVHLSVCDVGGSWSHRLKILETNCASNSLFMSPTPKGTWKNLGESRWGAKKWIAGAQKWQYLWNALRYRKSYYGGPIGSYHALFRFFGSPPYFYFQFRLYGHRDGRFCLVLARTAQQLVLDGTNGLSSFKSYAYCRILHHADSFAIAQLSCLVWRCLYNETEHRCIFWLTLNERINVGQTGAFMTKQCLLYLKAINLIRVLIENLCFGDLGVGFVQ